ncbi:MAG TPA: DUF3267 domain-containing protein [Paludibacteraceae bacterium]|jgi:hypothetical protein|nr:DUF3267 domain-containing protein [Paludibacteraceae bacterium]
MTYEELIHDTEYKELASLSHNEIKNFIVNEITENQQWARAANLYQLTGILAFMLGTFKAFMPYFVHRQAYGLLWLLAGIVFTFTILIVFHELIHALAYWAMGARHLFFGCQPKKFMFYVQADKAVVGYRQFKIIALAPTVFISFLSLLGMIIFYHQPAFYFFISIFGLHSLFAAGDFGLLCFFQNRPELEIVTFDVKEEGKTYFYGKEKRKNIAV